MKSILKTLTVASTLALPALAGCGERQEANPPTSATGPAVAPTSEQPKVIEKPAPPTATPEEKPKQEEAPKGG